MDIYITTWGAILREVKLLNFESLSGILSEGAFPKYPGLWLPTVTFLQIVLCESAYSIVKL